MLGLGGRRRREMVGIEVTACEFLCDVSSSVRSKPALYLKLLKYKMYSRHQNILLRHFNLVKIKQLLFSKHDCSSTSSTQQRIMLHRRTFEEKEKAGKGLTEGIFLLSA